jgi:hypothetical protein
MDLWTALAAIPGVGPYLPYIAAVGLVCAALSTALPPPSGKSNAYAIFYRAVNFLGLNFGHAKNAGAPAAAQPGTGPLPGFVLAVVLAGALGLSACTLSGGQQSAATNAAGAAAAVVGSLDPAAAVDGQLFCAAYAVAGPLFAAPQAVTVINASAPYVASVCNAWRPGAVPVPAPAVASVPVVVVGG